MRGVWQRTATIAAFGLLGILVSVGPARADGKQTLTGEVSDAMCGKQHIQGTPAECTRACVGRGTKYTLIVGDKIYSLNTDDKALRATLDKQAGKHATVTGTVNGVGVEVDTVAAAK